MIRLTKPSIDDNDIQGVRDVLESGFLVQGIYVSRFEESISKYVGTNYAIAVSNCTAALHLSLIAIGVQPGDWVIVPSYSFPATANAIELLGGRPVFIDIHPDTFNIDPNLLENRLKKISNKKFSKNVKAILPVHIFGQIADMQEICEIAEHYNIPVIEDAACALGAKLDEKPAGSWGILGCFSFHPRKTITTGEGGVITTGNPKLAHRIRAMRNHGLDPNATYNDFVMPGFNYRMTDFQGALGLSQMKKIDRIISARRRLAYQYSEEFSNTPIKSPKSYQNNKHIFQSYVVLLPPDVARYRDQLIFDFRNNGIESTIGTWHIPLTSYYKNQYGYVLDDFPITDDVYSRSLSLPLYEDLTAREQKYIVEQLLLHVKKYM